ncbi:MAG: hypothetical protein ACSLEN_03505 [Candidatus Malihini olakiniferum]
MESVPASCRTNAERTGYCSLCVAYHGTIAGVASSSLLLHYLNANHWLWVSPLSQPLSFGVIPKEALVHTEDVITCVSNHYHGDVGNEVYYSGECGEDIPPSVHALTLWSPFVILHQAYPPLPQYPC